MDGTVFDAMLKTALEEALRQDLEEAPEAPPPSRRQEKRMRRLLADPRRSAEPPAKRRISARWLAIAVIAALLGGAGAAGLALGNGERFRQMFEENSWAADYYEGAADTEQLVGMGAAIGTPVVEHDGLRFEVLDAIFDGQLAMMELRMTVLDPAPALLEKLQENGPFFRETEVLLGDAQEDMGSWSYHAASWETEKDLEEGEYALIFCINDKALNGEGRCSLRLRDLGRFNEAKEPLLAGEWTLSLVLQPAEVVQLEPNAVCHVNGVDWVLDSVALSPLVLRLSFHREDQGERYSDQERYSDWVRYSKWVPSRDLFLHLKNGEVLDVKGGSGIRASDKQMDAQVEFLMPLDLEQVDHLSICGEDIYLHE